MSDTSITSQNPLLASNAAQLTSKSINNKSTTQDPFNTSDSVSLSDTIKNGVPPSLSASVAAGSILNANGTSNTITTQHNSYDAIRRMTEAPVV